MKIRIQPLIRKLADNAPCFETWAPWDNRFKKLDAGPRCTESLLP
jgi:hypothetical protein